MSIKPYHISEYPLLKEWLDSNGPCLLPVNVDARTRLLHWTKVQFARALSEENQDQTFDTLHVAFSQFIEKSIHPLDDFRDLEDFFRSKGLNLNDLWTAMGTFAIEAQQGKLFAQMIEKAASKTDLVHFYFLAAWIFLNEQDYANCIRVSSQVQDRYGPLLSIRGQALLESGDAEKAREVLEEACELEQHDPLPWFQLAKADAVLGRPQEAWQALQVCDRLQPRNPEVAMFVLRLSFMAGEKSWAQKAVRDIKWDEWKPQLIASKQLGFILKELGRNNWYDLANFVLTQMT